MQTRNKSPQPSVFNYFSGEINYLTEIFLISLHHCIRISILFVVAFDLTEHRRSKVASLLRQLAMKELLILLGMIVGGRLLLLFCMLRLE